MSGWRWSLHRFDDAVAAEGEEVLHAVALGQQGDCRLLGQGGLDAVPDPDGDLGEVLLGEETAHNGAVGEPDIDRLAAAAKAGLLGDHPTMRTGRVPTSTTWPTGSTLPSRLSMVLPSTTATAVRFRMSRSSSRRPWVSVIP